MQQELLLGLYIVFFAVIHSLTAARFFKERAHAFIGPGTYRFIYTVVSVLTVLPLLYLWFWDRGGSPFLYRLEFPYYLISITMILGGAALVLNSLILTDTFEFLGIKHVLKLKPKEKNGGLMTRGAYGVTRHPLYLGGMLFLWSNPWMRLADLVVAALFTLYFVVGGVLEERKLEEEFGQEYREYKDRVSMFLPFNWILGLIRS